MTPKPRKGLSINPRNHSKLTPKHFPYLVEVRGQPPDLRGNGYAFAVPVQSEPAYQWALEQFGPCASDKELRARGLMKFDTFARWEVIRQGFALVSASRLHFHFKNDKDAALFKMFWGE